nr:hypothetical protein [Granulosicoccus sp.]
MESRHHQEPVVFSCRPGKLKHYFSVLCLLFAGFFLCPQISAADNNDTNELNVRLASSLSEIEFDTTQ